MHKLLNLELGKIFISCRSRIKGNLFDPFDQPTVLNIIDHYFHTGFKTVQSKQMSIENNVHYWWEWQEDHWWHQHYYNIYSAYEEYEKMIGHAQLVSWWTKTFKKQVVPSHGTCSSWLYKQHHNWRKMGDAKIAYVCVCVRIATKGRQDRCHQWSTRPDPQ